MSTGSGVGSTDIHVIIINYNAGDVLHRCVTSVLTVHEQASVLVVDNASSDGSAEVVGQLHSGNKRLEIHYEQDNLGFAPAVNAAAAASNTRFLLILNPDCELHPGALSQLRQALVEDEVAVLAAPCVLDEFGAVQRGTLRRFPDPWKSLMTVTGLWRLGQWSPFFRGIEGLEQGLPGGTVIAEAVSGACMLVRRAEFQEMGGLDEAYALHCEDLDLMYRLRQLGRHCLLVPQARVTHLQGVSSRSRPFWVHWQKHRGMQRFFSKFQASNYLFPLRWLVYAGIWLHYLFSLPRVLVKR